MARAFALHLLSTKHHKGGVDEDVFAEDVLTVLIDAFDYFVSTASGDGVLLAREKRPSFDVLIPLGDATIPTEMINHILLASPSLRSGFWSAYRDHMSS